MLHEIINADCAKFFLIYKDKEEVKERVIYFFPTNDNIINIINYAKSEGADYVCYRHSGPIYDFMPVMSTEGFDCVAIIDIDEDDFSDNLKESVMNAIALEKETHKALRLRYYLSIVKTLRITEEMAKYCPRPNKLFEKSKLFEKVLSRKTVLVEGDCTRNEAREQATKDILRFKGIIPNKD